MFPIAPDAKRTVRSARSSVEISSFDTFSTDGAHLDDLPQKPAHVVDRVALVEQASAALLGVRHVEASVILAGISRGEVVGVLGPSGMHRADPPVAQEPLGELHRRPVAPVVRGEHLEPARVTCTQQILHPLGRPGERLFDHEMHASGRGQPSDLEMRRGRRTDDDARDAVQRRLERRGHACVGELRSGGSTLGLGGVVRVQGFDADRVQVAEVAAPDRSKPDDRDLHTGSTRGFDTVASSLWAAPWISFHSAS